MKVHETLFVGSIQSVITSHTCEFIVAAYAKNTPLPFFLPLLKRRRCKHLCQRQLLASSSFKDQPLNLFFRNFHFPRLFFSILLQQPKLFCQFFLLIK